MDPDLDLLTMMTLLPLPLPTELLVKVTELLVNTPHPALMNFLTQTSVWEGMKEGGVRVVSQEGEGSQTMWQTGRRQRDPLGARYRFHSYHRTKDKGRQIKEGKRTKETKEGRDQDAREGRGGEEEHSRGEEESLRGRGSHVSSDFAN